MLKNFIFLSFVLITACDSDRGSVELGNDGQIIAGKAILKCEKPRKSYASNIDAAVVASVDTVDKTIDSDLTASLKKEITKLSDYSQSGLDLDLILFRLCEMSINRGFSPEQAEHLFRDATQMWGESEDALKKN